MRDHLYLFLLLFAILGFSACEKSKIYTYRWFYVSKNLNNDQQVEEIRSIVKTAAEHKLNGMYFSAGFDRLDLNPPDFFRRLKEVQAVCQKNGIEIIPRCLDVGYNGSVLAHDKNLAEGIPVNDALFVVKGNEANLAADPPVSLVNGSFEKNSSLQVPGFVLQTKIGEAVFVDKKEVKDGKAALRFENLGAYPENPGRVTQEVAVHPNRLYRVSLWVKTEGLDPSNPFGSGRFRVSVRGSDNRELQYFDPRVRSTTDWRNVVVGFNSKNYDKVSISAGVWGGKEGKFWLDDLRLEEIGLVNLLRRDGTPLIVKSDKDGTVYEEGKDFAPVADSLINFRFNHDGPSIKILPGSRIKNGERLRVSWYHGLAVYQSQVTACVSDPKIYDIWRTQVKLIKETLAPKKYFLSVDEVRTFGSCEACRKRGMTNGQLLGDCVARQAAIIKEIDPQAEIIIWSDMFDPNHNAREREGNYYYYVDGSFTGSWNYIPKELIIACWNHRVRKESLAHFSGLGFRTLACGYYDADSLGNDKTWLEALDETPGAMGIMYTTWLDKYELLGDFGDLVAQPRANMAPTLKKQ